MLKTENKIRTGYYVRHMECKDGFFTCSTSAECLVRKDSTNKGGGEVKSYLLAPTDKSVHNTAAAATAGTSAS